MAYLSESLDAAIKSIIAPINESVELDEDELLAVIESLETKLELVKAKLAKSKGDYDFDPEKPKSSVTKVTGTYGKSYTDMDDEGKGKVAVKAATAVKRGRGRPRLNT